MSDSVQPQRRQPTRLPRPWDSPGKNTGVGCHFLLQCMKVESESEVAQSCRLLATPWTAAHQAPLSTGFSRQECWSGVPLPSPMFTLQSFTKKVGWPLLQMIPPSHSITAISVVLICNRAHFPSFPWAEGLVPNSNSDISRDENSEITGYQLITKN